MYFKVDFFVSQKLRIAFCTQNKVFSVRISWFMSALLTQSLKLNKTSSSLAEGTLQNRNTLFITLQRGFNNWNHLLIFYYFWSCFVMFPHASWRFIKYRDVSPCFDTFCHALSRLVMFCLVLSSFVAVFCHVLLFFAIFGRVLSCFLMFSYASWCFFIFR